MATTERISVVMKITPRLFSLLPLFLSGLTLAQETTWTDTLRAAVKTDTRSVMRTITKMESGCLSDGRRGPDPMVTGVTGCIDRGRRIFRYVRSRKQYGE